MATTWRDDDGAVYQMAEGLKVLVSAPNVARLRIGEDVDRIAEHAFEGCSELKEMDVPYTVERTSMVKALEALRQWKPKVHMWDWPYEATISEALQREIDEGLSDEQGFVYSRDGKRLLRAAPRVGDYWITEGVERIERLAFLHCRFDTLHVPYTCRVYDVPEEERPVFGSEEVSGCVLQWPRPYSDQDELTDSLLVRDSDERTDEYGVVYTKNGKRLLRVGQGFGETRYEVPDGVVTICDFAFSLAARRLTVSLPPTVRVIGDQLFGAAGGWLTFRKRNSIRKRNRR